MEQNEEEQYAGNDLLKYEELQQKSFIIKNHG